LRQALRASFSIALLLSTFVGAAVAGPGLGRAAAPAQNVTRSEFTVELAQQLHLQPATGAQQVFSDLPKTSPSFGLIMAAYEAGWISGYPNGTFQPGASLTREQVAKCEIIALGLEAAAAALADKTPSYADAGEIGKWAWGYVNEAQAIGILRGFSTSAFGPQSTFTEPEIRHAESQMATYLATTPVKAFATMPTAAPGSATGTSAIAVTPFAAQEQIAVQVSSIPLSVPTWGEILPSGASAYSPGANLTVAPGAYVGVYEVGAGNVISAFSQLQVTSAEIAEPPAGLALSGPQGGTAASSAGIGPFTLTLLDQNGNPAPAPSGGETVSLAPGHYTVETTRGPEYLVQTRSIVIPEKPEHRESFTLKRWINLAKRNWYSGDHHVHAAGCGHYESPTAGVKPEDMWRHILGEDLDVGCVLSWGPCWYAQKLFFEGKTHPLSTPNHLMRYDIEVSGFPSSHSGHVCLLRLKEDDYPGTSRIDDWPSWDLPILKWGKSQGGIVGFAHSATGLRTKDQTLPTYEVPRYDGVGANEYIVDVTHDAVDFISTVDTAAPHELNIWYHTLNCGYRTRISGETDFPCIYGDRVGMGRVYVKLEDGKLDFDRWCEGVKLGRSYVSDGKSHLLDFQVDDAELVENGSELKLESAKTVKVTAKVAAYLPPEQSRAAKAIQGRPLDEKPYWDIERARVGSSRKVPVELVVNGYPAETREIVADGNIQEVSFELPIKGSSWLALRIYPSSHTNPIFVRVGGKPIRASKRSAEWCLKGVDQCWSQKERNIRPSEIEDARTAYEAARQAYRKILAESSAD